MECAFCARLTERLTSSSRWPPGAGAINGPIRELQREVERAGFCWVSERQSWVSNPGVRCQKPRSDVPTPHHAPGPAAPRLPLTAPCACLQGSEATGTMLRVLVGAVLPAMLLAAPPPINKLALFPDKSAWCEAKNITQIVGHSGCEAKSIQNRACLGQCFSYSVPNTFPQSTESLVHCDSCMPAQSMWEIVTLECPGHEEVPRVDKLVEKILHCSCQACGKEPSPEGLSVYVQGEDGPGAQPGGQTPEPEEPPGAPHTEEEGAED